MIKELPDDRAIVFCDESDINLPSIYDELRSNLNNYLKWSVIIAVSYTHLTLPTILLV